jgi:hypothetical protein
VSHLALVYASAFDVLQAINKFHFFCAFQCFSFGFNKIAFERTFFRNFGNVSETVALNAQFYFYFAQTYITLNIWLNELLRI